MSRKLPAFAVFASLLLTSAWARAADVACGLYQDRDKPDARLIIESATHASERSSTFAPRHYQYRRAGDALYMVDLDAGYVSRFTVHPDARLSDEAGFNHYALVQQTECAAVVPPTPRHTCRADLTACAERVYDADEATLGRWCTVEALPFACDKLIDLYRRQAKTPRPQDPSPEMPAACDERSPAFSKQECLAKVEQPMGQSIASGMLDAVAGMSADQPTLPPLQLDQAASMCADTGSATVCNSAASVLWNAGRYLQARSALELACAQGEDADTCVHAEALLALDARDERAAPASSLPCGRFVAATGLLSELGFGDRGLVEGTVGSRLRARLQDGLVRIRHDKGGDFVFRILDTNRLLGIDSWNEFSLYERQGAAATCSAPMTYEEVPLQADCPAILQPGGAQTCCDAGKLQGCNALGHQHALSGDWVSAKPHYLKVCEAGVRAGCENLLQLYVNANDDDVAASLDAICARRPTHVACDVKETANWEALGMARAIRQLSDEADAERD